MKSSNLDPSFDVSVAEQLIKILRSNQSLMDATSQDANVCDGKIATIDTNTTVAAIVKRLSQEFGGLPKRTDPGHIDSFLVAAAISLELLPNRYYHIASGTYIDVQTFAKLVARDLGIPKSAFHPSVCTDPSVIRW